MKITQVNTAYFSPTYSTKAITELVSGEIRETGSLREGENVDLSVQNLGDKTWSFGPEDLLCIGVPSYGGRVPGVAADRIDRLRGDRTPAVILTAYGNRDYEDTLLELKDLLTERGFLAEAGIAAVAQHSIVPECAPGRPDDKDKERLKEFAHEIWNKLDELTAPENGQAEVKGNHPYKVFGGSALKPSADSSCTSCMTCVEACPVGAIPADDPAATDKAVCICCMRCVKLCPVHARELNAEGRLVLEQHLKKLCREPKEAELFI